ncbi:MAG: DUF1330 domain-containing protein [Candidatus Marinimicrobia bacterium]|nr:DUF1330 domain-containing protein [Candidatus Neomarinimicrobiota bacterium]
MTEQQPLFMLNALWFKPDGGYKSYNQYMKAALPLVTKYGGRPVTDLYLPQQDIIGEFDADLIYFVEWPSWNVFKTFANDPDYLAIRHLREDAISKSLLIRCNKM